MPRVPSQGGRRRRAAGFRSRGAHGPAQLPAAPGTSPGHQEGGRRGQKPGFPAAGKRLRTRDSGVSNARRLTPKAAVAEHQSRLGQPGSRAARPGPSRLLRPCRRHPERQEPRGAGRGQAASRPGWLLALPARLRSLESAELGAGCAPSAASGTD